MTHTFLATFNSHDPTPSTGSWPRGYINHNPLLGDGREANRRSGPLPSNELIASMDDMMITGGRVARWFTYRGTHRGPLFGIPPTGPPIVKSRG